MTHRVARLRSLGLFALIAWLVACNPFSATPSPSPTPSAVQSTATASPAPTATGTPIAFVVPARGRMYVLSRGQRVFEPSTAAGANALITSFHALSDAELAGAPFATPTPAATRTADDVASAIARGFAQKDTA